MFNMFYPLIRPALFSFDAEASHNFALNSLAKAHRAGLVNAPMKGTSITLMGLSFPNKVGLAAGLDKDGKAVAGLAALGFGAIEIGTVTPRPQAGNPKPRLFRLSAHQAIINRMGFNNDGLEALLSRLQGVDIRPQILGINIGKNKDTPNASAIDDYQTAFRAVYAVADYVTVNISSPNTPGLRDLQGEAFITDLLKVLHEERAMLAQQYNKRVPIAVKIAPDLSTEALEKIAIALIRSAADAVIATNSTLERAAVSGAKYAAEAGGLSGAPLAERSTELIAQLAKPLDGALPIIGVGGILSADDAKAKIAAGASMVQLYSGLIYRGPSLISEVSEALG